MQGQSRTVTHPYLRKKGITALTGRIKQHEGCLIIPVFGINGELNGYQRIDADSRKRFLSGTRKKGSFFSIPGNGTYLICEGFATGVSLHQATGVSIAVVFDAGNLLHVGKAVSKKVDPKNIIIAGDNDQWKLEMGQPNIGADMAKKAALEIKARVTLPEFKNPDGKQTTDFNDLHRLEGLEAVKKQVQATDEETEERLAIMAESASSYEPPKKITIEDIILLANDFYKLDVSERQELLFPWLKEESNSLVSGWRGSGKTWFAMGVLDAVTKGAKFGPWECKKSVPCLFLDGEMTVSDDHERIKNLRLDSDREHPLYFYSDAYANKLGLSRAHLANESWRKEMKQILLTRKVKLWVVDNLASLASGLDENKKQDWDPINSWLLELRFAGISTIMLHHMTIKTGAKEEHQQERITLISA